MYKYLGIVLNEHLDYTETANTLSESAGRAFSSLIVNLYNKLDLIYSSYTKVYENKLVPIMDYSSSVWGAKCYPKTDTLHNQRTNGPVNAHLISWPSKAQDIQNLENIW